MGALTEAEDALQDELELELFVRLARTQKVRSYLEVGAKFGGTLRRVGSVLPTGSRIVAVDLPNGTRAWSNSKPALEGAVSDLRAIGQDARVIWGDSTDQAIVDEVNSLAPFDLILIDANHTLPYVMKDWDNYGPLGRMIAFHDIAWRRVTPGFDGVPIDVPAFWNSIKENYVYREIKCCPSGKNNGIGVLWRT